MINRRQFLKLTAATGAGLAVPWSISRSGAASVGTLRAQAAALGAGLSDPALQPKFFEAAPNALDPGYKYLAPYTVGVGLNADHQTGLINPTTNARLTTPIFGYGEGGGPYLWPGKTFEVQSGIPTTVTWNNNLPSFHLLPVDASLHYGDTHMGASHQYPLAANDRQAFVTAAIGYSYPYSKFRHFFHQPDCLEKSKRPSSNSK